MSQSSLPPEVRQLPTSDRMDLLEQIWNSIVEDKKRFPLSGAQKAELDRRLAAHEADPRRGAPWEEVKRRMINEQ